MPIGKPSALMVKMLGVEAREEARHASMSSVRSLPPMPSLRSLLAEHRLESEQSKLPRPGERMEKGSPKVGDAVCVEIRRLRRLPSVLLNFREHLPSSWTVTLIHGPENEEIARMLPRHHLDLRKGGYETSSGGIRLMKLPARASRGMAFWLWHASKMWRKYSSLPVLTTEKELAAKLAASNASATEHQKAQAARLRAQQAYHAEARMWYNDFLKSPEFWNLFSAPNLLIFEVDTILCPQPSVPLEWWLGRFGYVGGPWNRKIGVVSTALATQASLPPICLAYMPSHMRKQ